MTHASVDYASLQNHLKEFLRDKFRDVQILSVSIDEDAEVGQDRVLEISIVFRGTPADLVRTKPAGLTGMLKDKLAEMRETAFPVLSFIPG